MNLSIPGKQVKWVFNVYATPDPEFHWYDPRGVKIDPTGYSRYEIKTERGSTQVQLLINEIEMSDMGHYTLHIQVDEHYTGESKLDKQVDMYLNIPSDPKIKVIPQVTNSFYISEKPANFSCNVQGFPVDLNSLKWTFRHCTDYENCDENEQSISADFYTPLVAVDGLKESENYKKHYAFQSDLTQILEQSGIYTCQVCTLSNAKCNQNTTSVFVNDFGHEALIIQESKNVDQLVEGDKLELKCQASKYNYSEVLWYTPEAWNEFKDQNSVTYSETEFSLSGTLKFPAINIPLQGDYICGAKKLYSESGDLEEDEFLTTLTILKSVRPVKTKDFSMNGAQITKQSGESLILNCTTEHGRPSPRIEWYKDGKPLQHLNDSAISLGINNSSLKFKFLYLEYSGKYECIASNRAGDLQGQVLLEVTDPINFPGWAIALITSGGILVLVLSIILAWRVKVYQAKYKKLSAQELLMFEKGDPSSINPELGVDDQADLLPYNKSYEFPRESLKLGKQLGSGAFGRVVKAKAIGINTWERSTNVAVKMVKPNADIMYVKALMSELKIMMHLGRHLNIVNLLGACTKGLAQRELFVIVEYCRFGNLQKYLLQHRHHFISQIDPLSGEINFSIGQDVIEGYGNGNESFARAREEEEMSAVYLRHGTSGNTGATGNGDLTNQIVTIHENGNGEEKSKRPPSVRYVINPSNNKKRNRTVSIQSDYSAAQMVTTDMTTLAEDEDEDLTKPSVERSQSVVSRNSQGGPGWRANMRGDYDVTTVKPIATKDLICWAYQVIFSVL